VFSNSGCLDSLLVTWFARKGSTRIVGLLKALNSYAVFDWSMLSLATMALLTAVCGMSIIIKNICESIFDHARDIISLEVINLNISDNDTSKTIKPTDTSLSVSLNYRLRLRLAIDCFQRPSCP
jgi:hypothetical protein